MIKVRSVLSLWKLSPGRHWSKLTVGDSIVVDGTGTDYDGIIESELCC